VRNTLAVLHGTEIHGGIDLDHAYSSCRLTSGTIPVRMSPWTHVAGAIGEFLTDAGNAEMSRLFVQRRVVTGTERASGAAMSVLFKGRVKTLGFAARHIFGADDFVRSEASLIRPRDCDVLVTDYPLIGGGGRAHQSAICVPHWLRQSIRVHETWSETVEHLPASLRKELRRYLRKRDYRARIVSSMVAKREFYERQLNPYIKERFGTGAVIPNRRTYEAEAEASVLFELRAQGEFLGASLLKRDGDTLFVGRTAFSPSGATPCEVLDFFCLVLAQRLGCRYMDLGLTRPNLEDGVLLYKSKWRPQLVPAGALKSMIRIYPLRATAATMGFLSRNGFIERRSGRFVVRRLSMAGEPVSAALGGISELAERTGLDEMVVAFPGAKRESAAVPAHTRLCVLGSQDDPVAAFLRAP
jgi:hypothetical protein